MNPENERRAGWGRRFPWLLPLVIGLGLGALLVSILPGFGFDRDNQRAERQASVAARAERQQTQSVPRQDERQVGPREHFRGERGDHRGAFAGSRRGPGLFWFPFGLGRVLLPLLLIGAGAWLLMGGRRGPGSRGGTPGSQTSRLGPPPSTVPVEEPPSDRDPELPSTGETRRL